MDPACSPDCRPLSQNLDDFEPFCSTHRPVIVFFKPVSLSERISDFYPDPSIHSRYYLPNPISYQLQIKKMAKEYQFLSSLI